jgi:hypothetical protein
MLFQIAARAHAQLSVSRAVYRIARIGDQGIVHLGNVREMIRNHPFVGRPRKPFICAVIKPRLFPQFPRIVNRGNGTRNANAFRDTVVNGMISLRDVCRELPHRGHSHRCKQPCHPIQG